MVRNRWMRAALGAVVGSVSLTAQAASGAAPPDLGEQVRIDDAIAVALADHPVIAATAQNESARREEALASRSWPAPEAMAELWQVPLSRPYALGDAGMLMIGVKQRLVPNSLREARFQQGTALSEEARHGGLEERRAVEQAVAHVFYDYAEVYELREVHRSHVELARRLVDVARARLSAGGHLGESTQADLDRAVVAGDLAADEARFEMVRQRLNGMLRRSLDAEMGRPIAGEEQTSLWGMSEAMQQAVAHRPMLKAAGARRVAAEQNARAAAVEARWPQMTAGVLYFAPVGGMGNGYGASLSGDLPWIGGGRRHEKDARVAESKAAASDEQNQALAVRNEAAEAYVRVHTATKRLLSLQRDAIPASHRALETAWSLLDAGRGDVASVLLARRAALDAKVSVVMARSALRHALVDLDGAVGVNVPRKPLDTPMDDGAANHASGKGEAP